ncbi:zinc ribbon-containing protein [Pokkaliibacter sp. CJK22405]|uniref:zinc ribbon-containing protein n=1 Tax=Pokkaliibacter sp. CJK22405 TaxID=3384615 RepID=UPI00398523D9
MSQQPSKDPKVRSYERLLGRMSATLKNLEERSWPVIERKLEEAAELEKAAEDLTLDEIALIKEWVRRDIQSLASHSSKEQSELKHWLQFDLELLEHQTADWLLSVADQTQTAWLELQHRLTLEDDVYVAGEVTAPGTFKCNACDHMLCLTKADKLEPCHVCQNHYFVRITRQM